MRKVIVIGMSKYGAGKSLNNTFNDAEQHARHSREHFPNRVRKRMDANV